MCVRHDKVSHDYFLSAELERLFCNFYYTPCQLIHRAPQNDIISLTTYTTHTHVSDTGIKLYI